MIPASRRMDILHKPLAEHREKYADKCNQVIKEN